LSDDRCYLAALRILQYRFNSEAELRRKLRAKEFDAQAIEAALGRLRDEQWLNDDRFAGAFVRTKANKRQGRLRILRELRAAGVDDETAAAAVAENIDSERESEALRELCSRRARILVRRHGPDYLSTDEGRKKLAAYLLKQGYDAALVYSAIRTFTREIRVAHHQSDS
jgi:regulatory protein